MSRLGVQLLAVVIFGLAWIQSSALEPKYESGVLPIDPPTPYIHYFGPSSPPGRILVVHGLDVSKETMHLISAALADGGFEVYNIDLPGHGDSTARFQTDLAEQAISRAKVFLGEKTIVLGHSLGAGLLLDLAANEHFSKMVLLSPPPLSIAEIRADRVLIVTGKIDIPRIRRFVPIAADIGESKVESWLLPWGAHSAPIFNPVHIRHIVEWLGGDGPRTRTGTRILWIVLMLGAAVLFGVSFLPGRKSQSIEVPINKVLIVYVIAFSSALFVLKFVRPLSWLRLFATDYLVGFLLIGGLVLLSLCVSAVPTVINHKETEKGPRRFFSVVIAAAFVIAIPGLLIASQVIHMSLSGGRWWRFPIIMLLGIPLFLSDELTIRRIQPRWKSDTIALLTRGLLLAFILTGVLTFNRENDFLVLIVPLIVIFWIALWLAAGVVHRNTHSPIAAAFFSALVQGWAFAAWFVIA